MQLPTKQRNQIVKDIKLHNADLFTPDLTVQEELKLAQDLVYFQVSGEQQAYGLLGNAIVNRAPYFVRRDAKGVHLDTTWATYDLLSEAQSAYKVRTQDIMKSQSFVDLVPDRDYAEYANYKRTAADSIIDSKQHALIMMDQSLIDTLSIITSIGEDSYSDILNDVIEMTAEELAAEKLKMIVILK